MWNPNWVTSRRGGVGAALVVAPGENRDEGLGVAVATPVGLEDEDEAVPQAARPATRTADAGSRAP
jgi:hypothetical protein